MSGRYRDRTGSGDQDKEASASTQQSAEGTAEAKEQAQDSEGVRARYDRIIRADQLRPDIY